MGHNFEKTAEEYNPPSSILHPPSSILQMLLSSSAGPEIRPFPAGSSWRLAPGGGKFGDWSDNYMNRPLFKRSPWQFKRAPKRQCRMVKRKCSCRSSKFSAWVDCSKYLSRVLIKRGDQGHPQEPWMKQVQMQSYIRNKSFCPFVD